MNKDIRDGIVDLMAQPEQAAVTAMIVHDLVSKLKAVMEETALTRTRLDGFGRHVERLEAFGWVTDPTGHRDALYKGDFDKAKRQVEVLRILADHFGINEGLE